MKLLPVVFLSEEDKDKARMMAISVTLGALGGGCFVAMVIFEPGIIIWAVQTGGKALAIAVMVLSIIIPIAYKYDQKATADPEEGYNGTTIFLDQKEVEDILKGNLPNFQKLSWLKLTGMEGVMKDGKIVKLIVGEEEYEVRDGSIIIPPKKEPSKKEKYIAKDVPAHPNTPNVKVDEYNPEYIEKLKRKVGQSVSLEPGEKSELEINR